MLKVTLFAIFGSCLSIPLFSQQAQLYYLPQVIDGSTNTVTLKTTVIVTNVDSTNATVQISFTRDDGSPRKVNFPTLGAGTRFSVNLQPGGSQILQTDGSGDGTTGAATISSTAALGVSTIISTYDMNSNLLSESGASSSDIYTGYVIPIDTTGGLNTGFAILNPSAMPLTLTINLFDTNGTVIESASASVAAKSHVSRMVARDLFPDVNGLQGTLVVRASAPVAAVAIRQNTSANVYTLLDAVPQTSMGLTFYLSQIADGPNPTGTLQTNFLLYNLSSKPATLTLSLAKDSGAPWMVNIPGMGSNSTFTLTLAGSGSAFLQTDGSGPSTTGAASISSTQPIGVAAVVTARDGNGNVLTETGMTQSSAQKSFLLAFDSANNVNTGLALFNPSSKAVAVMVNQLDPSGNVIASAQSQPIPAGGHVAAYVTDFFLNAAGTQGALSVTATGSVGAAVAVLGLRQNSTPLAMTSTPVARLPLTGTGMNITSTLDSSSQATADISPAGGTLSLADAKGNKFTLIIPANALMSTTTLTMTALTAINGLPAGASFNAGVQLEPDGLVLFKQALLTLEPISPVSPDLFIPLGWHGTGQGVYLNVVQPQAEKLTFVLTHFSGVSYIYGDLGNNLAVSLKVLNIANFADADASDIAYWANKAGADIKAGKDSSADFALALRAFGNAYTDWVRPLMELALNTDDDDLLLCASTHALGYQRQRELMDSSAEGDAIGKAISSFVLQATNTLAKHNMDRCTQKHDPLAGLQLVGNERQLELMGQGSGNFADLLNALAKCPPNPVLKFQSEIKFADSHMFVNPGPSTTDDFNANSDLAVASTFTITATLNQASINEAPSFALSGSGPLNYESFSYMSTDVITGPTPPDNLSCTDKMLSVDGSTLKVVAPSEIKYKFRPVYNPKDIRWNGLLLNQFCPVQSAVPASVTLFVDPGTPTETISDECSDGSTNQSSKMVWLTFWNGVHQYFGDGNIISAWQIPGPNSFAHKEISRDLTSPDNPPPIETGTGQSTYTEKTVLDLNQPQP